MKKYVIFTIQQNHYLAKQNYLDSLFFFYILNTAIKTYFINLIRCNIKHVVFTVKPIRQQQPVKCIKLPFKVLSLISCPCGAVTAPIMRPFSLH